jgi:predicted nucleic acid-binding protein
VSAAAQDVLVIDASVALKWYLDDEDDVSIARILLHDLVSGSIRSIAPDHLRWEVVHSLRSSARAGRVTIEQGRRALENFLALPISYASGHNLIAAAYASAQRYDCAIYDAGYIPLADSVSCRFIYADRRLQPRIAGKFHGAMWISRYAGSRH